MRVKLPDGRDVTVDVAEQLLAQVSTALDQVVEVEIEESFEGSVTSGRIARGLSVLPTSGAGNDKPPKSVHELALEQNISDVQPDYRSIASTIWEDEEDIVALQNQLDAMRVAATT